MAFSDTGLILGIESSCDETAAAVVERGVQVRSNVIASQNDLHARYAGVVPEIASRAHIERILPVVREAVEQAGASLDRLDAIAVGHQPGLIGSLLVGVSAAKALAWSLSIPIIGIDHVVAHLHSGLLNAGPVKYPALGLVVSGGHTSLFHITDPLMVTLLGRTIDDAAGEAFDKAATILGLGYPGGPQIDRIAQTGDDRALNLPLSMLGPESLDFSFSGLKTAFLYAVCGQPEGRGSAAKFTREASELSQSQKADYAASFQRAIIGTIIRKLERAIQQHPAHSMLAGGGVTANSRLRRETAEFAQRHRLDLRLPPMEYCMDNAAMIAGAAWPRLLADQCDDWRLTASAQTSL